MTGDLKVDPTAGWPAGEYIVTDYGDSIDVTSHDSYYDEVTKKMVHPALPPVRRKAQVVTVRWQTAVRQGLRLLVLGLLSFGRPVSITVGRDKE